MEEATIDTSSIEWAKLEEFPGEADVKVLRKEPARGVKTILVRLKPGTEIVPHSHIGVVQHMIIEGSYKTNGKKFEQGTYRLLPSHTDVNPISSETGVTILMIYDPIEEAE